MIQVKDIIRASAVTLISTEPAGVFLRMLWFNSLLFKNIFWITLSALKALFFAAACRQLFSNKTLYAPLSTQKTEIKDSNKLMNTIKHKGG